MATATAVVVVTSLPSTAAHATSPLGDVAAAWPSSWTAYTYADGTPILDPTGDTHPDMVDLASGTGTSPTVYYAADGTTLFLRLRLADDPSNASKGGLDGDVYVARVTSGGTVVALAGAFGKSSSADYVFVASGDGSVVTPVYVHPFTGSAAGLRVVPDGSGQSFLDVQVPIARLATVSGGSVTGSTSVGLAVATSSSADLTNLNKDVLTGTFAAVPLGPAPDVVPDPEPDVVPDPTPDPTPDPVVPTPETPSPSVDDPPSPAVETPSPEVPTPAVETPASETPTPEVPTPEVPTPEVPTPAVPTPDLPSPDIVELPDPVVPTPEETTPEVPAEPTPDAPAPVLPGPVVPDPVVPDPAVVVTVAAPPATRLGTEVRDLRVVRGSVQRSVPELPFTGLPLDALISTGFVLVVAGAIAQRRPTRG